MKKALLTMLAFAGIGFSANAQLPRGSVAPDFTLTDIDGVSHHLYNYLDSGYTVILDISAAWCGPCWSAHQSHVFENLTDHYGPNGTISPKKIKVIFIEGEGQNTIQQLHGIAGSGSAQTTQGDWVTGSNYPIIDNTSLNTPYALGGFPTFTIICRDRLVVDAFAGYGSAMGQENFWLNIINNGCPSYGPSTTTDAKAVVYGGAEYFLCNATPSLKFQNYSLSSNITSATIEVLSGSTVVATQNWTGNLIPYGVATVNMSSFTPSQLLPYKFKVTVNNDSYPANNTSEDSLFRVFNASNAAGVSYSQDFEAIANGEVPSNFAASSDGFSFVFGNSALIGKNGQQTKAVVFDFFDMAKGTTTEIFAGNYKTTNASNLSLTFDVAYAQYATENDKLEVFISTDCGQNWTSVYSKAGTTLSTHAPVGNNTQFFPAAAADWRSESINLSASTYKNANMLVRIKGTSDFGNLAWVDNFKINSSTGISGLNKDNAITLYPNPASSNVSISFNMDEKANVQIQIVDAMGRVVKSMNQDMQAGAQKVDISTADLASGVYNVTVSSGNGSLTERLTVVN